MLKYAEYAFFAIIGLLLIAPLFLPEKISLDYFLTDVELACTSEEQALGLSFRESLAPKAGMLFVFPEDKDQSFWMKDMIFPLNIYWINSNGVVTAAETNLQPCEQIVCIRAPCIPPNCPSYIHKGKYVLETNAQAFDIIEGTALDVNTFPKC
jgi:uncharacterized membrane protein (UPF0127 family)